MRPTFNTILFYTLLIFLVPYSLDAQELPPMQNYRPSDYHGETQNWGISQDRDGVVYIANNRSLLTYDGATWKKYSSPNRTIIRTVQVNNDTIYTGCHREFGYWTRDDYGTLQYTSMSEEVREYMIEDEEFWDIAFYQKWILFVSLERIYMVNRMTGEVHIIETPYSSGHVYVVGKRIFFQKNREGLFEFVEGEARLVSNHPVFAQGRVVNMHAFTDGQILVVTQNRGLYTFKNNHLTAWASSAQKGILRNSIYSSTCLQDGTIILGTISDGVYHIDAEGKVLMHLSKERGLQNNTVLTVIEDLDNNLWLGLDNGLTVINRFSPIRFYTDITGQLGTVYAIVNYKEDLYLGTNQGLFYRPLDQPSATFKLLEGTQGQVWTLNVIDDTLYCGHDMGTFVVENHRVKKVCPRRGTWTIQPVEGHPDWMLQGNYRGLFILEKKEQQWACRQIVGFDMSSRSVVQMPDRTLFVNHEYKGVFRLQLNGEYTRVDSIYRLDSLPLSANSSITKCYDKLYYCCQKGVYQYDQETGKMLHDEIMTEKLFANDVFLSGKLIPLPQESMWGFTSNNVLWVSLGTLMNEYDFHRIPIPLFRRENVAGYECMQWLKKDVFILGTTNGYILINVAMLDDMQRPVNFSSIEVNKPNLPKKLLPLKSVRKPLDYQLNSITFNYFVPEFAFYAQTEFQVQMEGYDEDWSAWTNLSSATYQNLPAGKYLFKVRAKHGDNFVGQPIVYAFSIAAAWYASWWMILIYILCLSGLVYAIRTIYHRRYLAQKEKLERRQKLELQLLHAENEKALMQLKNDQLRGEVKSTNRELVNSTMAIVKKNELLNQLKQTLKKGGDMAGVQSAMEIIEYSLEDNSDWIAFQEAFNNADSDFLKKLKQKHPNLTPQDLKLCVYLRLNLSSKEIAPLLNISPRSVEMKRYRLRSKLQLEHNSSLTDYILNM